MKELGDKRSAAVERLIANAPTLYRGLLQRVCAGKASKRDAIRAKCLVCSGWVRAEVKDCLTLACPLWLMRPYRGQNKPDTGIPDENEGTDTTLPIEEDEEDVEGKEESSESGDHG